MFHGQLFAPAAFCKGLHIPRRCSSFVVLALPAPGLVWLLAFWIHSFSSTPARHTVWLLPPPALLAGVPGVKGEKLPWAECSLAASTAELL